MWEKSEKRRPKGKVQKAGFQKGGENQKNVSLGCRRIIRWFVQQRKRAVDHRLGLNVSTLRVRGGRGPKGHEA